MERRLDVEGGEGGWRQIASRVGHRPGVQGGGEDLRQSAPLEAWRGWVGVVVGGGVKEEEVGGI